MIETVLLESTKETDNKIRWDADIDGARFSLYIPKWRVPKPLPTFIYVTVLPYTRQKYFALSPANASNDPETCNQPIITNLRKFSEHTRTIRYQPEEDPSYWEIGEPYIPLSMTYDMAEQLTIIVNWYRN